RAGIFLEENLLDSWPETGPEEVFFIDSIGKGYGPPVISEDLMYFTGAIDSIAILFCFDLNGDKMWDMDLGKEWVVNYPGSRSSPTVVNDLIYVGTGMGDLLCINKKNQSVLWSMAFSEDYDGILPLFGHSESPVIHENKVFWTVGGKKHNVIALDRFRGDLIWSAKGKGERSGYNPPRVIITPSGRSILVTFSAYHLMGFDVETGDFLWSHEQDNFAPDKRKFGYGDTHANTIIYEDGFIYYAEGDGNCGVKLELSEDGSKLNEIWRNKEFDSFMGGVIKIGDYLYGGGTAKPYLFSIDINTGQLSDSLKVGRGVVVSADNMIYYYNQSGNVSLVSYDSGKLKDLSSFRIKKGSQEHFSHPVFHKGIMYLRHGHVIMGYKLK
ncbi:MAG: PQQ-binding-like beta-propeller repeat protein, partial [Bacteroidales bacterium]|nr:PQQ-binding-like beta-propeller repeat protein [Bacteroidales bacterium]